MKQSLIILFGTVICFLIIFFIFQVNNPKPTVTLDDSLYHNFEESFDLFINEINIKVPLIFAENLDENQIQKYLEQGVVHYPMTAMPGQIGNCYIFGHSSDYASANGNYKTVFSNLDKLKTGSIVVLQSNNRNYSYEVFEKLIVAENDLSVLSQMTGNESWLTLQTSFPVGTAQSRLIIKAKLIAD